MKKLAVVCLGLAMSLGVWGSAPARAKPVPERIVVVEHHPVNGEDGNVVATCPVGFRRISGGFLFDPLAPDELQISASVPTERGWFVSYRYVGEPDPTVSGSQVNAHVLCRRRP